MPVAVRTAAAATDRLDAAARAHATAAWQESLALAGAALDAAAAAAGVAAAAGPVTSPVLPDGAGTAPTADAGPDVLRAAAGRLSALLGPAGGRVRVTGDLALSAEVTRTAGQVLRYALDVEEASGTAARETDVLRTERLAGLELAAGAAATAASALADLEPLVPLATTGERSLAAGTAWAHAPGLVDGTTGSAGVGRPARLRPGAPVAVTEFVRRWANGTVPAEALCPVPFASGHLLQCDAAAALTRLNDAYRAAHGTDLDVVSSYRPLATQVSLRATKGGLAAVPGTSNHGWGLAVDLGGLGRLGQFDAPAYRWLKEHAEAFGWHHPRVMEPGGGGPLEPWHWEFATR